MLFEKTKTTLNGTALVAYLVQVRSTVSLRDFLWHMENHLMLYGLMSVTTEKNGSGASRGHGIRSVVS